MIKVFYFSTLLLILIKITKEAIEDIDFPSNEEFNIRFQDTQENVSTMYVGHILGFLKVKTWDKTVTSFLDNFDDIVFDFNNLNLTNRAGVYEIQFCDKCNSTALGYDCSKTCIEKLDIGYGSYVFVRLMYISFIFIFAGTLMALFGRNHYLFSIFFEFSGFLYLFIIDCKELFNCFIDNVIPFYILASSGLTGFLIGILGNIGSKHILIFNIFKVIKACIIGYFFIKTILYYISIFTPINNILYLILLLVFILLGGVLESLLKNKFKTDQILFIHSSVLAGCFYITKGISSVCGGYFSDTMTSQLGLKYNFDAKLRVTFFLVFHLILIAGSLFYQIKDFKNSLSDEPIIRQNSGKTGNYSPAPPLYGQNNKDINNIDSDKGIKDMSLKDSMPGSSRNGDVNLGEIDENADLNDQDE